jgi:hypothetical protein
MRASDRDRKRAQRQREKLELRQYKITVSKTVIEAIRLQSIDALRLQGVDAKVAGEQADRSSRSRKKVAVDLAGNLEQWAADYIARRSRF